MMIPDDIAERTDRAIAEARELQIASDELRRLAQEIARASELLQQWIAKHRWSRTRFDTARDQP